MMGFGKTQVGWDLKRKIFEKKARREIGEWAKSLYFGWPKEQSSKLTAILFEIGLMADVEGVEMSYEEMEEIANDLIALGDEYLSSRIDCDEERLIKTQEDFGWELKKRVFAKVALEKIGMWSFSVAHDLKGDLYDLGMTLATLEEGPEFAMSYEELDQIADDLIAGRDIKKHL